MLTVNLLSSISLYILLLRFFEIRVWIQHCFPFSEAGVSTDMYQWARRNPPPATIMVISGHVELECLASTFSGLENKGYRILLTYPQRDPVLASLPKHCFWETLLSGVLSQ